MSSYLQVLADLEAAAEEAKNSRKVADWLVSGGIIQPADSSQGPVVDREYVSGPNYVRTVEFPETAVLGLRALGLIFTDWPKLSSGFVEDLSSLSVFHPDLGGVAGHM